MILYIWICDVENKCEAFFYWNYICFLGGKGKKEESGEKESGRNELRRWKFNLGIFREGIFFFKLE